MIALIRCVPFVNTFNVLYCTVHYRLLNIQNMHTDGIFCFRQYKDVLHDPETRNHILSAANQSKRGVKGDEVLRTAVDEYRELVMATIGEGTAEEGEEGTAGAGDGDDEGMDDDVSVCPSEAGAGTEQPKPTKALAARTSASGSMIEYQ